MTLDEESLPAMPIDLLRQWFEEARSNENALPEAMALATVSPDAKPSNRFVLLKDIDERGVVFFTNYDSRKGRELAANPHAAAAVFWHEPRRQVRIEGTVERLTARESDAYFRTRDWLSRIGALVSPQSRVIEGRAGLDREVAEMQAHLEGRQVPRPDFWGGYRLVPEAVEFWSSRDHRLHDRIRYRVGDQGGWLIERLAP